ncbi:MAG: hypothetical protein M3156_04670 [Thermoproteota archaeon]|nr:hypothetical protein [Thermoproteota archaeon]
MIECKGEEEYSYLCYIRRIIVTLMLDMHAKSITQKIVEVIWVGGRDNRDIGI